MFPEYGGNASGEAEDEEEPDEPMLDDDLHRAIVDAQREAESENEKLTLERMLDEKKKKLILSVQGPKLECRYGIAEKPDVELQLSRQSMEEIINGRMTFQRAFMSGAMKTKGDFRILRTLDQLFLFEQKK